MSKFFSTILIILLFANLSSASCGYQAIEERFNEATYIFIGKIISKDTSGTESTLTVDTSRFFKGAAEKRIKLIMKGDLSRERLVDKQVGDTLLFSATSHLKDKSLEIGHCDWRRAIGTASKEVKWLEANKKKK